MKNNIKTPCNACPFRKNSAQGWLGGLTAQDTYDAVMNHEIDFACHKTRDSGVPDKMSRCRGSLLFLKQGCKLPRYNNPLKLILEEIDRKQIGSNILLPHEFLKHHTLTP